MAQHLELVTVTESSFVLSWFTADRLQSAPDDPRPIAVESDSLVRYGTNPDRLDRVAHGPPDTAYHLVEVSGLRPGVTYHYQASSSGVVAVPRMLPVLDYSVLAGVDLATLSVAEMRALVARLLHRNRFASASPGSVTTLVPPPGRPIATIALTNDLHVGETQSGLIVDGFPPPFSQTLGGPPYPVAMGRAMLDDVARRRADVLIVAGDLTSAGRAEELTRARQLLNRFGTPRASGELRRGDYLVARGNHDRSDAGDAHAACPPAPDVPALFPLPQGRMTVTEFRGLRLVGLDTTTRAGPGGAIGERQWADLRAELGGRPQQPTLVYGHHPVTGESARTTLAGPSFDLNRADAARLERLYAQTPGVFLHHAGHTHRNKRTASPVATGVEFLEVAAIKEYPGGYGLLRVYEGGYLVNFYRSSGALAREWSEVSGEEYLGLYPVYTLGSLADRNHVVRRALL